MASVRSTPVPIPPPPAPVAELQQTTVTLINSDSGYSQSNSEGSAPNKLDDVVYQHEEALKNSEEDEKVKNPSKIEKEGNKIDKYPKTIKNEERKIDRKSVV